MNVLFKITQIIGKYMAIIILGVAALALFVPKSSLWIQTSWVNYLLMLVMFGMGLTMKISDFKVVFTHPKAVIVGCVSQFTIMPLLAFGLGKIFGLEAGLLAGVILVGTCPGGTASNVITYLSKGDVPLSVGMTSINTLLAPLLTPVITYLLLKTTVSVNVFSMFLSIIQVVILPIALGLILNHFFGKKIEKTYELLPMISVLAISLIVACVVSHNSEKILTTGAIVFVVVILHNILGYLFGYLVGLAFRLSSEKKRALSIEIGMQNSGLATSLANTAFNNLALATVPGAVFSVWHNISGALLASIFRYIDYRKNKKNSIEERNCFDSFVGYKFYGWENANVKPINNEYKGIDNPIDLYNALSHIWCKYTCAPRLRENWTKDNMTLGQCSITAFLAQDIFGGEVYGIKLDNGNYHCYNVIDGCKFDLTSEQFGDTILDYSNNPIQLKDVHFSKEEKRLRYEYLKEELKKYTNKYTETL